MSIGKCSNLANTSKIDSTPGEKIKIDMKGSLRLLGPYKKFDTTPSHVNETEFVYPWNKSTSNRGSKVVSRGLPTENWRFSFVELDVPATKTIRNKYVQHTDFDPRKKYTILKPTPGCGKTYSTAEKPRERPPPKILTMVM